MTAPVSFISPLTITAGMITSSTAVARSSSEPEWAAGTFAVGAIVFRQSINRRFECLIAGPSSVAPEDDLGRWYDLGVTDKMTMFDGEVSTQSIADGVLTVVLRPGPFNAMDLRGLEGVALSVKCREAPGGSLYYNYSGSLEDSQPDDYYEHFFSPFKPKTDFLATDLPPFASCEVTISVSYPGMLAKCGMASFGDLVSLGGQALSGLTVKPKSYARITTDDRGKTSIKKGKAARDLSVAARVPVDDADRVSDALVAVLGVPCTWIAIDLANMRTLRTFGLGSGELTYDDSPDAMLSLNVQGMI